ADPPQQLRCGWDGESLPPPNPALGVGCRNFDHRAGAGYLRHIPEIGCWRTPPLDNLGQKIAGLCRWPGKKWRALTQEYGRVITQERSFCAPPLTQPIGRKGTPDR